MTYEGDLIATLGDNNNNSVPLVVQNINTLYGSLSNSNINNNSCLSQVILTIKK